MSQNKARNSASSSPDSSTPDNSSTLTPASTAPNTPGRARSGSASLENSVIVGRSKMDKESVEEPVKDEAGVTKEEEGKADKDISGVSEKDMDKEDAKESTSTAASGKKDKKKVTKCKKHAAKKKKKQAAKSSKRSSKHRATSSSDSDSDASTDSDSESEASESDSDTSSSSEDEKAKKKRKARAKRKAAQKKKEKKAKKHKKSKKQESSDDSDSSSESDASEAESESEDSSADEHVSRRRRSRTKSKRVTVEDTSTEAEETTSEETLEVEAATAAHLQEQLNALHLSIQAKQTRLARSRARAAQAAQAEQVVVERSRSRRKEKKEKEKEQKEKEKEKGKSKKGKKGAVEFKRVDELWDSNIHDWKLRESNEEQDDQFGDSVFTVRRRFNWENKYRDTVVDIKSKLLREALQTIMKDVKSVSLVEEEPCLDPNTLFLYLEEIRQYYKKTIKTMIKKEKKRKQIKRLKLIRSHVKVMMDYLDEDYGETKKKLYPLLEAGNITFDLLWALFKPNTLAFTNTYGSVDDPRCFKVDYAYKEQSFIRGEWYAIEGRYLEYDGKHFGLGDFSISVDSFKGPRKITSLATYPLQYHKENEKLREQLIERGKKFVMMQGMNYKFHKGLAFVKKKKAVAKVTINGRVMIDPAIFRRINPNYPISVIKPKEDHDVYSDDEDDCSCDGHSDDDYAGGNVRSKDPDDDEPKMAWKIIWDKDNKPQFVRVPVDEHGQIIKPEKLEQLPNADEKDKAKTPQVFSEEELLIASPVVLGFSFKEKLWLEFSLSGIQEIEWNDGAFESLVIPPNQKSIVKALVSSHKFHAAETIDDVVQGKGKGLVFVLHGPPGVGKTLTAEGIAETLKTPLYAVSAGELGMDQRNIEHELQRIMDIAHSWGAVLLLDEADVFLEKRQVQDVGRNAMVSIFLRLLEYFQGILFLTTNRVETFDEAFQSRIHLALKYEELGQKARKDVWKQFLGMVKSMEGKGTLAFTERDYELLARHNLNGRQIKNAVRTAQALAVNERQRLTMEHIQRVLAVAESFERDMKGLTLDAMKQYV